MEKVKAYTDLEQSKKLAEILPLESADMNYFNWDNTTDKPFVSDVHENLVDYTPCWSLAALLAVLPDHFYDETGRKKFGMDKGDYSYYVFYETQNSFIQTSADNLVDACVAMIEKLHEQNLL